jgi:hypothetical protein
MDPNTEERSAGDPAIKDEPGTSPHSFNQELTDGSTLNPNLNVAIPNLQPSNPDALEDILGVVEGVSTPIPSESGDNMDMDENMLDSPMSRVNADDGMEETFNQGGEPIDEASSHESVAEPAERGPDRETTPTGNSFDQEGEAMKGAYDQEPENEEWERDSTAFIEAEDRQLDLHAGLGLKSSKSLSATSEELPLEELIKQEIKQEPSDYFPGPASRKYPERPDPVLNNQMVIDLTFEDSESEESESELFVRDSSRPRNDLDVDARVLALSIKTDKKARKAAKARRQATDKQKNGPRPKSKKIPGGVKKKSSKPSKRKTQPATNSGVKGVGGLEEIFSYDIIQAHHAQSGWDEAPGIEADTKKKQLKDMLAGCPEDSHMPTNRSDKEAINRATKAFGRNRVSAINGKWLLNGMKTRRLFLTNDVFDFLTHATALYHHQILGAAWMFGRETRPSDGPLGGILADSMVCFLNVYFC